VLPPHTTCLSFFIGLDALAMIKDCKTRGEPARFGRFSENRSVETQKIKIFEKNVKKLESLRRIVVKKLMK
jgi:hypothetical protein